MHGASMIRSRACTIQADNAVISSEDVSCIDISRIESQQVVVYVKNVRRPFTVTGFSALELVWSLKPGALEGRRLKWAKYAWVVHNMIAHPVMQLLAFVGLYDRAMWLHDVTVPKPIGFKTNAS